MVASICNKIYSYVPALNQTNVSRLVIGGVGVGSYLMGWGVPLSLIGAGTCYLLKNTVLPEKAKEKKWGLDDSVILKLPPNLPAAKIRNQNNSCFCSAILWTFFGNEPAALRELPKAIARRVQEKDLPKNFLGVSVFKNILNKQGRITQDDFNTLRTELRKLENSGLSRKAKELLSLLELHELLQVFQAGHELPGDRVNDMRKMVSRVNSNFEGVGARLGDAQEVFQSLGDLIFEGSDYSQTFDEINILGRHTSVPNWGNFEVDLERNKPISELLEKRLEGSHLTLPPEFLAVTVKRNGLRYEEAKGDLWVPVVTMEFDPIIPEPEFVLRSEYFLTREPGVYELVGVARRRFDMAHYDAVWKRDSQWYYGDDLRTVYPIEPKDAIRMADTGYLFFYRKKS